MSHIAFTSFPTTSNYTVLLQSNQAGLYFLHFFFKYKYCYEINIKTFLLSDPRIKYSDHENFSVPTHDFLIQKYLLKTNHSILR